MCRVCRGAKAVYGPVMSWWKGKYGPGMEGPLFPILKSQLVIWKFLEDPSQLPKLQRSLSPNHLCTTPVHHFSWSLGPLRI